MNYRVAICDDDQVAIDVLEFKMSKYKQPVKYESFLSGELLYDAHIKDKFDIILLDIQMPGKNGIEVAKMIRETDTSAVIVFTTAMDNYALEAYSVQPLDFLVKPINDQDLYSAIDRAIIQCKQAETYKKQVEQQVKSIVIEVNTKPIRLKYDDIIKFETSKRNIVVTTINEKFTYRSQLSHLESKLDENRFVRFAQHGILNLSHVESIESGQVKLDNGESIYPSRRRMRIVNEAHTMYLWAKETSDI